MTNFNAIGNLTRSIDFLGSITNNNYNEVIHTTTGVILWTDICSIIVDGIEGCT